MSPSMSPSAAFSVPSYPPAQGMLNKGQVEAAAREQAALAPGWKTPLWDAETRIPPTTDSQMSAPYRPGHAPSRSEPRPLGPHPSLDGPMHSVTVHMTPYSRVGLESSISAMPSSMPPATSAFSVPSGRSQFGACGQVIEEDVFSTLFNDDIDLLRSSSSYPTDSKAVAAK